MSAPKPHNKLGIYSNVVFYVSFGIWILAVWLVYTQDLSEARFETLYRLIENVSVIPFGIGAFMGLRALYQRGTNPMFPFMGFALNGIMVFRVVYNWLGWAFGW